ncbi:VOC family protein [Neorhizobium galegae]|uniref:VOC family protein n=1 Tax=Neorhizobium galegae TaxID=399 RepID=UPI000621D6BC|nr:VOC family protein [Neorhizobium galegae]CDZ25254.1 Putative glyoxalase/bleomycin resistance protein/dioxygenase protein [Neorhizobium galegae bv. officinalis]KAA9387872.1 VOC family protein [Neorhizobium galegae]KAB1115657.1 VOC family protein [Neorhizobium galegae]MCM2498195.1 VOC family protein [Neorhizobium galegae]MCQ1774164.1 VOC family protein [Neorhizobium galegae]
MRMNHIDIHVSDVAATSAFLVRHFGLTQREMRGTNGLAILADDAGLEIVVSRPVEKFGGAEQHALGVVTYHLGFIQPERADVDRLYRELKAGDAELVGEPREMRGGYLFYCLAPGRVMIEVGWRE